jgi:glucose-1-phosphate adenylyltransferase
MSRPKFQTRKGPAPRVLAIILAGGEGKRLLPLTLDRAKPAVPIGGRYRLIDFVLSNFVNSGIMKIKVLTQYKSDSLNTHLARGWRLPQMLDLYVEAVPAQMRTGKSWFLGSADALYQSMNVVTDEEPDFVCVFSADHMYKMDVRQMVDSHIESGADMSVAAIPVPVSEAFQFGIVGVDKQSMMVSFKEKPQVAPEIPDRPGWALASMGNYIWNRDALIEELLRDATTEGESQHDFGKNILPNLIGRRPVAVYDFAKNEIPERDERERGYWRDVGTLGAYFAANMDLVSVHPVFDLYNPRWPIRTPHLVAAAAAGEVRVRRRAPCAYGDRHRFAGLGGLHHLGRAHRPDGPVTLGAGAQLRARRGVDRPRPHRDRTPRAGAPGDRRQERDRS